MKLRHPERQPSDRRKSGASVRCGSAVNGLALVAVFAAGLPHGRDLCRPAGPEAGSPRLVPGICAKHRSAPEG